MRDIRYIIKRVIIGVCIAVIFSFIRANALEISSTNIGGRTGVVSNLDTNIHIDVSGSPWSNWRQGYLYMTYAVSKIDGTSTASLVTPRGIFANSGSNTFVCSIGTTNQSNSTWTSVAYSVKCPMDMGSSGLTSVDIVLADNSANDPSIYRWYLGGTLTYEQVANTSINNNINVDNSAISSSISNSINSQIANDNTNTQSIINNQNTNTQSIISNQNTNNQNLINNQNQNAENTQNTIKDNLNSCDIIDVEPGDGIANSYLQNNGIVATSVSFASWKISDYISLRKNDILSVVTPNTSGTLQETCFYTSDKTLISCRTNKSMDIGVVRVPTNTRYFRFSFSLNRRTPVFTIKSCVNKLDENKEAINDVNNTLNDSNVDSSTGTNFFDNFSHDSHGLSGLLTSPLRLINALTTASCSPLSFQLPFVHNNVSLPCMRPIYQNHFGVFFSLYQLITTGLISYLTMINIYSKIHNLQNPNNDRIEVLNL